MTSTYLKRVLVRDLGILKDQINAYPDDAALWELPPGVSNSGGTLALHLIGNVRHFIGAQIGRSGYVRERELEFSARNVPPLAIDATIDAAIREVSSALDQLNDDMLDMEYPLPFGATRLSTGQFLTHLVAHFGYHLGQIDYHRRITTGTNDSIGGAQFSTLV